MNGSAVTTLALDGNTVAVIASLSTLGAFILAAIGLYFTIRATSQADHQRIAQERQQAIDAAVANAKQMMQLKVDELKNDVRTLTEDRNYWRRKADDLQSRLDSRG